MAMKVRRRDFLKLVGTVGVASAALGLVPPLVRYVLPPVMKGEMPRSQLVWEDCSPVKASELKPNVNYVFYYPLIDTVNILVKLETPDGRPIRIPKVRVPGDMNPLVQPPAWLDGVLTQEELEAALRVATSGVTYEYPGGVGPDGNIVAFSAICQHLGCPFPALRFYAPGKQPPTPTNPPEVGERGGMFHCLCHGSAYDPARAAAILTPPTVKPQPAIKLEWDPRTDELYAVDVVGPTILGKACNTCGKIVGERVVVAEEREPETPTC